MEVKGVLRCTAVSGWIQIHPPLCDAATAEKLVAGDDGLPVARDDRNLSIVLKLIRETTVASLTCSERSIKVAGIVNICYPLCGKYSF